MPATAVVTAGVLRSSDDGAACDLHNVTGAAGVRVAPSTLVGILPRPVLPFLLPKLSLILSFQLVDVDRVGDDGAVMGNACWAVGGVVGGVMMSAQD